MFSDLMLLVIFIALFSAWVYGLGAYTMLSLYVQRRIRRYLFVGLAMVSTLVGIFSIIGSALLFNAGMSLSVVSHVYKFLFYSTLFNILMLWFFMQEFMHFWHRWMTVGMVIVGSVLAWFLYLSPAHVIYVNGTLVPQGFEFPILPYAGYFMLVPFTAVVVNERSRRRRILRVDSDVFRLLFTAGTLAFSIYLFGFLYYLTNNFFYYFLAFFSAMLGGVLFYLANVIPSGSPLLRHPFRYYQSRILDKMALTFTLLMVVSLEGVSFLFIRLGRQVLADARLPSVIATVAIRQMETQAILLILFVIAVGGAIAIYFTQRLLSPIRSLSKGIAAIGRGDLTVQIPVDSSDELGRAAAAFNRMVHDLRESHEQLIRQERLSALGTMAAGMAHEIKNPLVSIRTFLELLPEKYQDEEFREKFGTLIKREVQRINHIAENLMKFARPPKLSKKHVDIKSLVEEQLYLFHPEFLKHKIKVKTSLESVPPLWIDEEKIAQVLINLVLNAVQALPTGGEIHMALWEEGLQREGWRRMAGQTEGMIKAAPVRRAVLEITDNGPGISEQERARVFDPLYTTKPEGTGMGLPICIRIMEEHAGKLRLTSDVGAGTTFTLIFPIS